MANMKRKRHLKWNDFLLSFVEIWRYDKSILLFLVLNVLIESVKPFPGIILAGAIVDRIVEKSEYSQVIGLIGLMFGTNYVLSVCGTYIKQLLDCKFLKFKNHLDREISDKCMKIDFEEFNDSAFQDRVLFTNNMAQGNNYLMALTEIFDIASHLITMIGVTLIISFLDIRLLIVSIVVICLQSLLHVLQLRNNRNYNSDSIDERRKIGYTLNLAKDVNVKKDLHIFNQRPLIMDKIISYQDKLFKFEKRRIHVSGGIQRLTDLLSIIFQATAYLILGTKVYKDLLSVGEFTRGVSALINFMSVSMYLTTHMLNVNDGVFYLHKYKSFLNTRSKYDSKERQYSIEDFDMNELEIEFRDVSFRYPNSTNYVLKHINLKIHKLQRIAIVGYNGAGKTTFILLLTRMYEPTEGAIYLNGVDIRRIKYVDYLKLFSSVNQDYSLLAFSLFENVSCKSEINEEEKKRVISLLEANGMGERLKKMYRGGDTPISKLLEPSGIDFSGGEKQSIAITRALYKKAPILLMDEPTSSLDPMAEQRIYRKFSMMSEGCTSIFISHRIYSTRFCDVIAVFEKGEIKEYGTFDELIEKQGLFYDFYKQQADYFVNG